MKRLLTATIAGALAMSAIPVAFGQSADDKFVSKDEYQKLQRKYEALDKEMEEFRAWKRQMQEKPPAGDKSAVDKEALSTEQMAKVTFPGTTKLLLTGYGAADFVSRRFEDQHFSAQFNPMFLWKLSDRVFFEGELEFELEEHETDTKLELANVNYVANDYMTFVAGKFLNPMDSFTERYHMAWINRLPDKPLAVYDGLLPETYVGAQVRGGLPVGPTKMNYSVFVGNAPELVTSGDDEALGTFDFDSFDNTGGHVAVGGHVGFLPIPELEVGYGIQYSSLGNSIDAFLHSVDFNYVRDSESLRGLIRLNAQWTWSLVDSMTYASSGGPLNFSNHRDGGYAQFTYRPTKLECLLKNVEGVIRYDMLNQKKTPVGFDEKRYTLGLNYWLNPSTVFKAAYQFDDKNGGEADQDAVLVQFAVGF